MTIAHAPDQHLEAPRATPQRDALVRIEGLTKRFTVRRTLAQIARRPWGAPRTTSVDSVSFDIRSGEFFGLLGPNGAGKTTLLKMLATLILPDEGTATIDGRDLVIDAPDIRRLVAPSIANERSLYWRLTARANLELFAALLRIPKSEVGGRVEQVLGVVGLTDTGTKLVGQFSSGMMQRLLIARALLSEPRVLLLDEPTRSLDPLSARAFRRFLREELAERRGCAVLLATHSAEEAFDLCDRVGVLDRGRLLAVGTVAELSARFTDARYRVWTTDPRHPALMAAATRGTIHFRGEATPEQAGWWMIEFDAEHGLDAAANVLDTLVGAGMPVARFERVPPSLADLIEHVVARRGGGSD